MIVIEKDNKMVTTFDDVPLTSSRDPKVGPRAK
jgi:hypothetical protein